MGYRPDKAALTALPQQIVVRSRQFGHKGGHGQLNVIDGADRDYSLGAGCQEYAITPLQRINVEGPFGKRKAAGRAEFLDNRAGNSGQCPGGNGRGMKRSADEGKDVGT